MSITSTPLNVFSKLLERERLTRLEAEQASYLKDEFLAVVSHELRTPLTTIKTLVRLMQLGGETPEERGKYLEAIETECDRQIDLVLNLLDLSRLEAGALQLSPGRVDAAEVIGACYRTTRHSAEVRRHHLSIELPARLPPIYADHNALRRVLTNLIENAIKYTPEGGRITVRARVEPGADDGDEVSISVIDSGRGIPPDDLPHIFKKFYRSRPNRLSPRSAIEAPGDPTAPFATETAVEGTHHDAEVPGVGLGLYLARTFIEQLGGRISVESVVRVGSTFTVRLLIWQDKMMIKSASHT